MDKNELPIPKHFKPAKVGEVWRVDYQNIATLASDWANEHKLRAAAYDRFKVCLILVDVQNTFCIPGYELYVGGRTGTGAVDDNKRLTQFIYKNLHRITEIVPTMDTHQSMQIFHSIFFVNDEGAHPLPYTQISVDDIKEGKWKFNKKLVHNVPKSIQHIEEHLVHYAEELTKSDKYNLTIWPYHAMLGGIGHALVSSIEEAIFFHTIARLSQPYIHVKGDHPLTEHYSVLKPEISSSPDGEPLSRRSEALFEEPAVSDAICQILVDFDVVIIAGQAKSHCVAWTISDLLNLVTGKNEKLIKKIYVLEDCTSPIVVSGEIDYTDQADQAFQKFSEAGINIVLSTDPISNWPGINL